MTLTLGGQIDGRVRQMFGERSADRRMTQRSTRRLPRMDEIRSSRVVTFFRRQAPDHRQPIGQIRQSGQVFTKA